MARIVAAKTMVGIFIFGLKIRHGMKKTRKELKEKHNIIFNGGVRPIMVVRRDGEGLDPLLIVGSEDDGTICFTRKYSTFDNAFDVGFTKSFIRNLKDAAEYAGVKI